MMAGRRDLLAASLWAVLTLLSVRFTDSLFLRTVMSLPLVFFLPGYVLLRVMKPIGTSQAERIVYAAGLSIAVCLLFGLILNWAGWLVPAGWAAGLTAIVCIAALFGRRENWEETSAAPHGPTPRPRRWQAAVLGVALFVACGAYLLAVQGEASQREFKYTELWMLYGSPKAPGQLIIGVKSAEDDIQQFDMEVAVDGRTIGMWHALALAPGDSWTRQITVPIKPGHTQKAEAWLYRPEDNTIYRRVSAVVPGA
jgi:uncharacterized membrane protein